MSACSWRTSTSGRSCEDLSGWSRRRKGAQTGEDILGACVGYLQGKMIPPEDFKMTKENEDDKVWEAVRVAA